MTAFRSRTARLLILAVLLSVAASGASAREVRLQGPNGDGGSCPDAVEDTEAPVAQPAKRSAAARGKAKAAPMMRSGGENTARPRWHSFLPGMFR